MDKAERQRYQTAMGTIGEVPADMVSMHERFEATWKRLTKRPVPDEVVAWIVATTYEPGPRMGDRVVVDGRSGEYLSKWRADTVRIRFDQDEKPFRVVKASQVNYV